MAIPDVAEEHFTFESRLASFQTAQQLSKRRASNANSKAPKSMKWPHKFLSPQELAKAGFFYCPLPANPDNVACFLCHKSLDGWEEGDDPLSEHLKHSPDCGWAIVASIEKQDEDLSQEYPSSARMLEARKATFADRWPHEGKKGWKCKVKQLADAGWKYTPTPEYDDMATCVYCSLALDGWEPGDKPIDEHAKRSPDCPFFILIQNHKQSPAVKKTKSKRDRTSKASRLSIQSSFTVATEDASLADLPAEEGDSILTTATTATTATATGKKMGKGKKNATAKGRKTRAKRSEPMGVETAPEPEDDDFEVKVDEEPKPTRGRKRKSDQTIESSMLGTEAEAPQPKRRATRTKGSMAVDDSMIDEESVPTKTVSQPKGRKGRASTKSTRKASAASAVSLRAPIPNDDEIDQALEADLERQLTDDEAGPASAPAPKKGTRSSKVTQSDHAMFSAEPMEVDEAAIEAELEAMEVESKPPPKAKGAKGKPRKPSAKQQAAAAKKAALAEAAAEAERLAEEEAEASRQIEAEFENSISMQHSSPIIQPKKQRASRQPAKRATGRATRGSVMSVNESNISIADKIPDILDEQKDDSGNETDASMASRSTVVRGGASRAGAMKKGRGGNKAASRNIEEIVRKPQGPLTEDKEAAPSRKGNSITAAEEIEEPVATLEDEGQMVEEPAPKPAKPKAAKPRGRPAKPALAPAPAPVSAVLETSPEIDETIEEPAPILPEVKASKGKAVVQASRSPTPPPKEATPSQSPQSSDAENQPPSSKPSAAHKKAATPHSTTTRIPLASTPVLSPSKRNLIAGLQTAHPWKAVDLDAVFLNSPSGNENSVRGLKGALGDAMEKAKNGNLTSPEKKMSVEEWIHYNAGLAEEKLRGECERMVGIFEREGGKAMRALEGVGCVE